MKKKFSNFKKSIVQKAELAPEAIGCMRLTVIDNTNVYLENHKGVIEYTQKRIGINIGPFSLIIKGANLTLESFGKENVAIVGEIVSIQYDHHA